MKKIVTLFLAAAAMCVLFGCGSQKPEETQGKTESEYKDALEVLTAITGAYTEEDLFSMYGGDAENAVMDAPGKFDIQKTEELDVTLGLPEGEAGHIEDAASMVHMMNANTFTGAAYRLADGVDKDSFAKAVQENILAKQWVCGFPDTLLIVDAGGPYIITAYGEAGLMEVFKTNVLSAVDGADILTEMPIS